MIFDYDNLEKNEDYLCEFSKNSVIQVNNLVDNSLCNDALEYFLKNESYLIEKYGKDKKGLVLDQVSEKNLIKYFEYPLSENFKIFGPFVNNKIINLASKLLNDDVFLRSMEIHTRGPGSTEIPPHQDNGYYGLINSNALTFYIALNSQLADKGGLKYIPNKIGLEYEHTSSDSKAFSLCISKNNLPKKDSTFKPNYSVGDCTIHHANSIHFAESVKMDNISRSIVVRLSFFGVNPIIKDGHLDWYHKMLKANRKN